MCAKNEAPDKNFSEKMMGKTSFELSKRCSKKQHVNSASQNPVQCVQKQHTS